MNSPIATLPGKTDDLIGLQLLAAKYMFFAIEKLDTIEGYVECRLGLRELEYLERVLIVEQNRHSGHQSLVVHLGVLSG